MILRWPLRGFCLLLLGWLCCGPALAVTDDGQAPGRYRGKRILWIDSYHAGYEWTDGIGRGIQKVLADSGVELKIWRMDTKRNKSEAFGHQAGLRAKAVVEKFRPDVLIASDDNAQQYLVVPFLKDTDLPVVFCGVNGDPGQYGYPSRNVTGMVEVDLVQNLAQQLRRFARGDRIGVLASDTETVRAILNTGSGRRFGGRLKVYLVHTFEEYRQAFLQAQQEVDMLHLANNAGIEGWDDAAAEAFLTAKTVVPTGTINTWMAPFVMFTLAKQPEEQGEYAARTALKILDGARPGDLPLTSNQRAQLTVNLKMAKAAGIVLPVSLLQTAEIIGKEAFQKAVTEEP